MDTKKTEGRQEFTPHPASEIFPEMTSADLAALVHDIQQHGQLEPIVTHDGLILDGRHRHRACRQLGIEPITTEWNGAGKPTDFVISKNLHRRHLNSAQKREVIAKLLNLSPEKSNRQIAAAVGVDDKTVGAVRSTLEGTAEFPQLGKTVGADGKSRPTRPQSLRVQIAEAKRKMRRARASNDTTAYSAAQCEHDSLLKIQQEKIATVDKNSQVNRRPAVVAKLNVISSPSIAALPKAEPRRVVMDSDFQAEADAAARDLEIERDERIALSGAASLVAENESLKQQRFALDRRISALMSENASLKNEVTFWKNNALKAGWKGRGHA